MTESAIQELLRALPAHADEYDFRHVLADAMLSAGDPRGPVMRAQLAEQALDSSLAAERIAAVRAQCPEASYVRVVAGMLVELHLPLAAVAGLDLAWLASEPLIHASVRFPYPASDAVDTLAASLEVLRGFRGVTISTRTNPDNWRMLLDAVRDIQPTSVGLDASPKLAEAIDDWPSWPSVEIATIESLDFEFSAQLIRRSLPNLRRVRFLGCDSSCLMAALARDSVHHIDVRGYRLAESDITMLQAWLDGDARRSVRHPHFGLRAVDLDDVFGDRGLSWEPGEPLSCRVAPIPGEDMSWGCARGTTLQLYHRDAPRHRQSLSAEITALAGLPGRLAVGRADGRIEAWSVDGASEPLVELPGAVRSLSSVGADLLAVHDHGVWTTRDHISVPSVELAILTASGLAWAEGSRVLLQGASAAVRDIELGERVLALASHGDEVLALAGRHVWRLTDDGPEHVGRRSGGRPALAVAAGVATWISSPHLVRLLREEEADYASYAGYRASDDPMLVADICVMAPDTVVVAFELGGMNLLLPDSALKADEFPGEPGRGWTFIYRGQILVAS